MSTPEEARVSIAISCRVGSRTTNTLKKLGVSRDEILCKNRVMKETDGIGGPWFHSFTKRLGGYFYLGARKEDD